MLLKGQLYRALHIEDSGGFPGKQDVDLFLPLTSVCQMKFFHATLRLTKGNICAKLF